MPRLWGKRRTPSDPAPRATKGAWSSYSTVPEVLAHGPCGPTVFNQSQLTLRFLREVIG
jgi:hypothetical protein